MEKKRTAFVICSTSSLLGGLNIEYILLMFDVGGNVLMLWGCKIFQNCCSLVWTGDEVIVCIVQLNLLSQMIKEIRIPYDFIIMV